MENEMGKVCQSCAMPMADDSLYGTNKDGSQSDEFCKYCYENGAYTSNQTLEEMINVCVPFMVQEGMPEAEARSIMEATLPQLKRWKAS